MEDPRLFNRTQDWGHLQTWSPWWWEAPRGVITEDPRSPKRGGAWSTVECGLWAGAPRSTPSFPTTSWLRDLQLPCLNFLYSQIGDNLSPSAETLLEVSGSRDRDAVSGHGFAVMTVLTTVALTCVPEPLRGWDTQPG